MSTGIEYPVILMGIVFWLVSWYRRGIKQETLLPAILDGGAAAQLPVGTTILAGVLGLIDPALVSQVMSQPMIAAWAGMFISGLGIVSIATILKL
jgi:hypothetical protein